MADSVTFDRSKHGLRATRKFVRSGVAVAEKDGRDLTDREVRLLSDDDVAVLHRMGLVEFTQAESGRKAGNVAPPSTEGTAGKDGGKAG